MMLGDLKKIMMLRIVTTQLEVMTVVTLAFPMVIGLQAQEKIGSRLHENFNN